MLFALVFIAIVSTMNSEVVRYGNAVNHRVNNQIVAAENYELQSFDGTLVTGDTVISAIKNQDTLYSTNLEISVNGTTYTRNDNLGAIGLANRYRAELVLNDNDIIVGVRFTSA